MTGDFIKHGYKFHHTGDKTLLPKDMLKIIDEVENEIINLEIDQIKGTIAECFVEVVGEVYGTQIEETYTPSA